jgi:hypothetical protein
LVEQIKEKDANVEDAYAGGIENNIPSDYLKHYATATRIVAKESTGKKNRKSQDFIYLVEYSDNNQYWVTSELVEEEYTELLREFEEISSFEEIQE